jgi:general secretion pathway protein F
MLFQVKAVRGRAEVSSLPVEARDAGHAAGLARAKGYDVLAVRRDSFGLLPRAHRRGGGRFPLLLFNREFVALLEAGLNVVPALETLAEKESADGVGAVLEHLLLRLRRGVAFSDALEEMPKAFPPLYVATVRSNERTGGLVEALTRFGNYQAQMEQVRSKVVSALIYPALLLVAAAGVAGLLLFYVVPRFRRVFEEITTPLPLFSRLLVEWGRLVDDHGALIVGGLAVLGCTAAVALSRASVRRWLIERVGALPGIDSRYRVFQFARFYRTLAMLQRSGLPIASALSIGAGLLGGGLRQAMDQARASVHDGMAFSAAMEQAGLTTPVAYRLLLVGEHSGQMPEMLNRIAAFYEEQLARWIERFTRLFEPLLMAAIGVVIGLVVVFLYMPIFEIAGSIR